MAQPTQTDVHIDKILTQFSVAYMQQADNFVASKVFPIVPVEKQSDKYFIYTKNDWFRDEAQKRADATESSGSGYGLSTGSYMANVYAHHKDVGDQVRANTDNPLDPDRDATNFVTQRLLLRQEIQWASDYFGTGIWGTDKVGATDFTKWSDYTGSDPISDIEDGKDGILGTTGYLPNTLVLGYKVFKKLKHHPDIVDRIKYTGGLAQQVKTEELLAQLFNLDRVLVTKAVKATNNEGETAAYSYVHANSALLCYVNPQPSLLAPSAGYIFSWKGISGGLGENIGISRFRMEHLKADRIEGQVAFANKVIATDLGYFFSVAI